MDTSPAPFTPYGHSHLLALGVGAAVTIWVIHLRRGRPETPLVRQIEKTFAFAFLSILAISWLVYHFTGLMTPDHLVPCHLCDLATVAGAVALIRKSAIASELTYFWGLGASLQGLITPNLSLDFPHPLYFTFFAQHLGIVIIALYLPLGRGWRPRPRAWWHVFLLGLGYLAMVGLINYALGSNYAFVCRRPDNPSLLDYLGPWPFYLICMTLLAGIVFGLLALPFSQFGTSRPTRNSELT